MPNDRLRRLRLTAELTQEQVAQRVSKRLEAATGHDERIDANTISRLERGIITWPRQAVRTALRQTFGVATDAELGIYPPRTRADAEKVSESHRRSLLSATLASILPDVMPSPSRLGMADIDGLADRTYALEEWDRRTGGENTRHLAYAELRAATDLTQASMGPKVRDRLSAQIANLADLSAWSAFDSGMSTPARSTFRLGIQAARDSSDPGILCHVATGLARQEIEERHPDEAIGLADMAMGDVPLSALSMIAVVKAKAYALKGDERKVMRHISLAEAFYSRIADLDCEPRWLWYFTEHKLQGEMGDALFILSRTTGRPAQELVARLRHAVDSQSANRARTKAISTARLATTLYRQGARDEARHYGALASKLAGAVRSARLDAVLSEMESAA
jgi:transcriptional regulator with XRE-family HTH domain